MLRSMTVALLVIASATWGAVPMAAADDPQPVVDIGTPPAALARGADAMIRADGSSGYVGGYERGGRQQVEQSITQFQRAVSYVRVCSVGVRGRMRVHGTGSTVNWRVKYRVGRQDVTRSVVAGTYRTSSLRRDGCARRIRVVASLQPGSGTYGHTFRIQARPTSGERDVVETRVSVTGVLVLP